MSVVTASIEPRASRARYALGVLAQLLGTQVVHVDENVDADVSYPAGSGRVAIPGVGAIDWDDPSPDVTLHSDVPVIHPRGTHAGPDGERFDLLYATYACLTAPWERVDAADDVGCPIAGGGFLDRHGLLLEPLVHRYAERLAKLLGRSPVLTRRLVVTHDVDDNFSHLFRRRDRAARFRREPTFRRAASLFRSVLPSRPDPNDRFEEWAAWHQKWGSRPSYFVASRGLLHGGDKRDVSYDVAHPNVRKTLRAAVASGAEIGVHFSIGAHASSDRLRAERELLEEAINAPVRSARHHWWSTGPLPESTIRRQAKAGVELDLSFGFNDRVGFRRAIAAPFRPWDPVEEEAGAAWALPTLAMDAAVCSGRTTNESLAVLRTLREITGNAGGSCVLDWHVHAANPVSMPGAVEVIHGFVEEALAEGFRPVSPLELLEERTRLSRV